MTSLLLVLTVTLAAQAAEGWTCDPGLYEDGTCDCGCGVLDADCAYAYFDQCDRAHCPAGEVPWEHESPQCMASACGDGWKADDEACDDFDALDSGGCNADCSAVNAGETCGERAEGCSGGGGGDTHTHDGGVPHDHDDPGHVHCGAAPAALPFALLALLAVRRRR